MVVIQSNCSYHSPMTIPDGQASDSASSRLARLQRSEAAPVRAQGASGGGHESTSLGRCWIRFIGSNCNRSGHWNRHPEVGKYSPVINMDQHILNIPKSTKQFLEFHGLDVWYLANKRFSQMSPVAFQALTTSSCWRSRHPWKGRRRWRRWDRSALGTLRFVPLPAVDKTKSFCTCESDY